MDFPTRAEELTSAWLDSSLHASGTLNDTQHVVGHHREPLVSQGYTADVCRVHLDYDVGPGPASLVAKFPSRQRGVRNVFGAGGYYEREVLFYRVLGTDAGIPIPRCHAAEFDPEGGHFVLLLEDLCHSRLGETGSVTDVELAIDHLARFHARWWGNRDLERHAWLSHAADPAHRAARKQLVEAFRAPFEARYADAAPPIVVEAIELLLEGWDALAPTAETRLTLSHGDYRPGQLFFATERGGRFAVSDWQTAGLEPPGVDLARIIVSGLGIRQRRAHDKALIDRYLRALLTHGVRDFDRDELWKQCRLGLLQILLSNLSALIVVGSRRENLHVEHFFARLSVALEDWKTIDLMRGRGSRSAALVRDID